MPGLKLPGYLRLLVIAILLSGCTTTVPLKPTVDHVPSFPKMPLSAGIYYSPELRSYMYESVHWLTFCQGIVFPLGQASVTLLERLFPIMFHNAVTLESRPTLLPSTAKLSLIIEPDIEEVQCAYGDWAYSVEITYHFFLYSPSGEALGYWLVTGRGEAKLGIFEDPDTTAGKAADLAMEDAASKIAIQFRDIPAVQRLLQEGR